MPTLTVRNLDPDVYANLKTLADAHHSSIAAEAHDILREGVRRRSRETGSRHAAPNSPKQPRKLKRSCDQLLALGVTADDLDGVESRLIMDYANCSQPLIRSIDFIPGAGVGIFFSILIWTTIYTNHPDMFINMRWPLIAAMIFSTISLGMAGIVVVPTLICLWRWLDRAGIPDRQLVAFSANTIHGLDTKNGSWRSQYKRFKARQLVKARAWAIRCGLDQSLVDDLQNCLNTRLDRLDNRVRAQDAARKIMAPLIRGEVDLMVMVSAINQHSASDGRLNKYLEKRWYAVITILALVAGILTPYILTYVQRG
jgi:plasmid stability protein